MTYREFLNNTKNDKDIATFLYNFAEAFYCERLVGVCDKPCEESYHNCYTCLEWLVRKDIDWSLLERK